MSYVNVESTLFLDEGSCERTVAVLSVFHCFPETRIEDTSNFVRPAVLVMVSNAGTMRRGSLLPGACLG